MSRFSTHLLLVLALLGALWHPLCACAGARTTSESPAQGTNCCEAPEKQPVDPCGQPSGQCECERQLLLAWSLDGVGSVVLPALDLPPTVGVLPLALELEVRSRPAPRALPPRPPDRARLLPLRI